MESYRNKNLLTEFVENRRKEGKTVGFVPTMGALHQGHISLIKRSNRECDITIASIFVNPTQFNEAEDLEKYPRTEEADAAKLKEAGCNVLFLPTVEEIYPDGAQVADSWDFGSLAEEMEGANRPGHFEGVAQVVFLLLSIIRPDIIYMGQKDFQQYAIIRRLAALEKLQTTVKSCLIIRERDGLAMSSRNLRISEAMRKEAVAPSRALFKARALAESYSLNEVKSIIEADLAQNPHFELEYFEIADIDSLVPLEAWPDDLKAVICIAGWIDGIRLIDNVLT
ncbi:MAG: pantoate--beta-alanine ligase [Limisphaerales bacterium]|jgi:pantoate--beta-alanine ligase